MKLQSKLFLSHMLVALASILLFLVLVLAIAPHFLISVMNQMMGASNAMNGMMTGSTGPAQTTTDQAVIGALHQALFIAILGGILLALILGIITARFLARPINRIAAIAARIEQGEYHQRITVPAFNHGDELEELAERINRMASALEETEQRRKELIGDAAHELRTPLTTLQGTLEGMLDGVILPEPERIGKLVDETGRMRRLVDDLQELSRAESHRMTLTVQPCSAVKMIDKASQYVSDLMEENGLSLSLEIDPQTPMMLADPDRAAQIVINLLTNALRYTPPPGKVTVSAEGQKGMVCIKVVDTGLGLQKEDLQRIFDRFYRVDKSRSRGFGGSGIGLTISRALAEQMHGNLSAESLGLGKGSTFTLTLPQVKNINIS